MQGVQLGALFDGAQTMKDRSVKMTFYTSKEMGGVDAAELFKLVHTEGWLLFSPNEMTEQDVPESKAVVKGQKTPGQRLRAVLYIYWQQTGSQDDFETFYSMHMERFIDKVKGILEP